MSESAAPENLPEEVSKGKNFRTIDRSLIKQVAAEEFRSEYSLKVNVERARSKLHQICNAYRGNTRNYAELRKLIPAQIGEDRQEELRMVGESLMRYHVSTRERLPFIAAFYQEIFRRLPPIHSVLDLACGMNPAAIGWMLLAEPFRYEAHDVYSDLTDLLNEFFRVFSINGAAHQSNLLSSFPSSQVDLTLLLKTIPCLEQIKPSAGAEILEKITSPFAVVSYPIYSLSGKQKGMREQYENRFNALISTKQWEVERLLFDNEMVFLLKHR
ncbi:MAG: hypothetical protein GX933_07880 [Chloroflexi bacterium]|nr:hypothetical protein [Chloroflexota bacterium]